MFYLNHKVTLQLSSEGMRDPIESNMMTCWGGVLSHMGGPFIAVSTNPIIICRSYNIHKWHDE